MRDGDNGAFVIVQEAFQPGDRFGIKVVGWFVQQQHVWFFQQQTAQRNAATFTTGEHFDLGIPGWQTQCIGSAFQLVFHVVTIVRLDDRFQFTLFFGQLVEIGIGFGIGGIDFVQTRHGPFQIAHGFFNRFTNGLLRIEFRLLRQVTDLDTGLRTGFAFDFGINAGHDAQQG